MPGAVLRHREALLGAGQLVPLVCLVAAVQLACLATVGPPFQRQAGEPVEEQHHGNLCLPEFVHPQLDLCPGGLVQQGKADDGYVPLGGELPTGRGHVVQRQGCLERRILGGHLVGVVLTGEELLHVGLLREAEAITVHFRTERAVGVCAVNLGRVADQQDAAEPDALVPDTLADILRALREFADLLDVLPGEGVAAVGDVQRPPLALRFVQQDVDPSVAAVPRMRVVAVLEQLEERAAGVLPRARVRHGIHLPCQAQDLLRPGPLQHGPAILPQLLGPGVPRHGSPLTSA
ncbi:hypothetical protein ABZS90_30330 [Streptomyces cyaneofuscatus]